MFKTLVSYKILIKDNETQFGSVVLELESIEIKTLKKRLQQELQHSLSDIEQCYLLYVSNIKNQTNSQQIKVTYIIYDGRKWSPQKTFTCNFDHVPLEVEIKSLEELIKTLLLIGKANKLQEVVILKVSFI